MEFDHAVIAFYDAHLSTGLVEAVALAQFQVLGGDERPARDGGGGHDASPSRLVTDKNQSSSDVRISCSPYTAIPAPTSRRWKLSSPCPRFSPTTKKPSR